MSFVTMGTNQTSINVIPYVLTMFLDGAVQEEVFHLLQHVLRFAEIKELSGMNTAMTETQMALQDVTMFVMIMQLVGSVQEVQQVPHQIALQNVEILE